MSSNSKSSSITSESVDSSDSVPLPRGQTAVVNQHGGLPTFAAGGVNQHGGLPTFAAGGVNQHGGLPTFAAGGVNQHGGLPTFAAGGVNQHGGLPTFAAGGRGVAQDTSQNVRPVGRPIVNKLYDPNFTMIGLPADPFLRQLMLNPSFGTDDKPK